MTSVRRRQRKSTLIIVIISVDVTASSKGAPPPSRPVWHGVMPGRVSSIAVLRGGGCVPRRRTPFEREGSINLILRCLGFAPPEPHSLAMLTLASHEIPSRCRRRRRLRNYPPKPKARDRDGIFGGTGRFRATETDRNPRLRRQSRGRSKTIPNAPGNRICAGPRGGAGRTRITDHVVMRAGHFEADPPNS
jgi:hypothetical protein